MLHRIKLRQFTPRQPIPDVQTNPQGWKPVLAVIKKQNDFHARAWEREYKQPTFDSDHEETKIYKSPKTAVRFDLANNETTIIPGNISTFIFAQAERSFEATDTDHYLEPDAETSLDQTNPTRTNPHSTNYDQRHNP